MKLTNNIFLLLSVLMLSTLINCDDIEEVLEDPFNDFRTYIEDEWEIDSVTKCDTSDVFDFYSSFSLNIIFDSETDDSYIFDYTTTNGSPAFPASGNITVSKSSDFTSNSIDASRSDGVSMTIENLVDNFNNDLLDFRLKENADCLSAGGRLMQGDYSFRCKRRRRS